MALKMCPIHTVSDFSRLSDNALVCFVFCFVLFWGGVGEVSYCPLWG